MHRDHLGTSTGARARLRFPALWRLLGFMLVAAVVVLSLMHDPPQIPGDHDNWLGHALAYGSMMGWFARLDRELRARLAWALAFCAMGVGIEFIQGMTAYRTYDVFDMIANAGGVALGWLASPPRLPDGIAGVDAWLSSAVAPREPDPPRS